MRIFGTVALFAGIVFGLWRVLKSPGQPNTSDHVSHAWLVDQKRQAEDDLFR